MSRSRKKVPYIKDHSRYTFQDKRNSWKAVRNKQGVVSGSMYRKVFCSYDICDYKFYKPHGDYRDYIK